MAKKILTICEFGNSRSVGIAFFLKEKGYEAIAIGICAVSPATLKMMCEWADRIIVTFAPIAEDPQLAPYLEKKILVWDLGIDRYWLGVHKDIMLQCKEFYERQLL